MNKPALKNIAIAGIHTGIGKTIVSAVIAEALGADYWKPVQAGIEERDTQTVQQLITNGEARVHSEAILLQLAASPHAAAAAEGVDIDYTKFNWPVTSNCLIVETAGGVLSPISATKTAADFIAYYKMPAILVTQNYLGSINHTLMSIEALKSRGITILGIVINGPGDTASEAFIEQYSALPIIARVQHFEVLNGANVHGCAVELREVFLRIVTS